MRAVVGHHLRLGFRGGGELLLQHLCDAGVDLLALAT